MSSRSRSRASVGFSPSGWKGPMKMPNLRRDGKGMEAPLWLRLLSWPGDHQTRVEGCQLGSPPSPRLTAPLSRCWRGAYDGASNSSKDRAPAVLFEDSDPGFELPSPGSGEGSG